VSHRTATFPFLFSCSLLLFSSSVLFSSSPLHFIIHNYLLFLVPHRCRPLPNHWCHCLHSVGCPTLRHSLRTALPLPL
jgi:hypothetical protein